MKTLHITRLDNPDAFETSEADLRFMLAWHADRLTPDGQSWQPSLQNLAESLPWLWVLRTEIARRPRTLGLVSLTDICPERHVYIHGVSHPLLDALSDRGLHRARLAAHVIRHAFGALNVLKVKAEFDPDNRGALGFCRRMGFRREALLEGDMRVNGEIRDIALYSLTREAFTRRAPFFTHILSTST